MLYKIYRICNQIDILIRFISFLFFFIFFFNEYYYYNYFNTLLRSITIIISEEYVAKNYHFVA